MRTFSFVAQITAIVAATGLAAASQRPKPLFEKEFKDRAVSIDTEVIDGNPEVVIRDRAGRQTRAKLHWRTNRVDDARFWNNTLVLTSSGVATRINVVRPNAARSDSFLCTDRATSPDNRFIVYTRFVPRIVEASTVYLAYDASLSPIANRMEPRSSNEDSDVGWAFFPSANSDTRSYQVDSDVMHVMKSPFYWISPHEVAFVDYTAGEATVVMADFTNGIHRPIIKEITLDAATLVDSTKLDPGTEPAEVLVVESFSVEVRRPLGLSLKFRQTTRDAIRQDRVTVFF